MTPPAGLARLIKPMTALASLTGPVVIDEVIINTWNRNIIPWWPLLPQGVSHAIKRRAGYAPFRELSHKGRMSAC